MQYRKQKNLTISQEQKDFIEAHAGVMNNTQLSKYLGLTVNIISANKKLLGLVKPLEARVVNFDRNGYFDVDQFGKLYAC